MIIEISTIIGLALTLVSTVLLIIITRKKRNSKHFVLLLSLTITSAIAFILLLCHGVGYLNAQTSKKIPKAPVSHKVINSTISSDSSASTGDGSSTSSSAKSDKPVVILIINSQKNSVSQTFSNVTHVVTTKTSVDYTDDNGNHQSYALKENEQIVISQ